MNCFLFPSPYFSASMPCSASTSASLPIPLPSFSGLYNRFSDGILNSAVDPETVHYPEQKNLFLHSRQSRHIPFRQSLFLLLSTFRQVNRIVPSAYEAAYVPDDAFFYFLHPPISLRIGKVFQFSPSSSRQSWKSFPSSAQLHKPETISCRIHCFDTEYVL